MVGTELESLLSDNAVELCGLTIVVNESAVSDEFLGKGFVWSKIVGLSDELIVSEEDLSVDFVLIVSLGLVKASTGCGSVVDGFLNDVWSGTFVGLADSVVEIWGLVDGGDCTVGDGDLVVGDVWLTVGDVGVCLVVGETVCSGIPVGDACDVGGCGDVVKGAGGFVVDNPLVEGWLCGTVAGGSCVFCVLPAGKQNTPTVSGVSMVTVDHSFFWSVQAYDLFYQVPPSLLRMLC